MSVFIILKLWFRKSTKLFSLHVEHLEHPIFDYIIRPTNNVAASTLYAVFFVACLFAFCFTVKMKNGWKSCVSICSDIFVPIKWFTSSWLAFFWSKKYIPHVYIGKFRFTEYYIYGNRKVLRSYFFLHKCCRFFFGFYSRFFCIQKESWNQVILYQLIYICTSFIAQVNNNSSENAVLFLLQSVLQCFQIARDNRVSTEYIMYVYVVAIAMLLLLSCTFLCFETTFYRNKQFFFCWFYIQATTATNEIGLGIPNFQMRWSVYFVFTLWMNGFDMHGNIMRFIECQH